MTKLYCVNCSKYRKFGKSKISYLLVKTLVLSIIWSKCKNEDEKIFKEEESMEILKILGLINDIEDYQKTYQIMPEENINQEFRLKEMDELRNYSIEEINQNELMSKKHKKSL